MNKQIGSLQENKTIDRLEDALTRIVTAVQDQEKKRRQELESEKASSSNMSAVAAGVDALCVRIRSALERQGD